MKKVFICLLGIFMMFTTGCDNIDNNPTKKVEELMGKYQMLDEDVMDDLNRTIDEEDLTDEQKDRYEKLLKKQYQDLKYTVKDEKIDGDNATVEVEIEVTDYTKVLNDSETYLDEHKDEFNDDNGNYSIEKYTDYKLDNMEKANTKVKYTLELTLTKTDDEWQLDNLTETERQKIHGIYNY